MRPTRPASFVWGFGLDKSGPNAQPGAHARLILRALTGTSRRPPAAISSRRSPGVPPVVSDLAMSLTELLPPVQRAKLLGAADQPLFSYAAWDRFNATLAGLPDDYLQPTEPVELVSAAPCAVFEAMTTGRPYPVRALFCQAANPLLTPWPTRSALPRLCARWICWW